jgi:hypothetical protein
VKCSESLSNRVSNIIIRYVDNIRSPKSLQEATTTLDRAARMMGLGINQAKTKYMICGTKKRYVEDVFKEKHMTYDCRASQ